MSERYGSLVGCWLYVVCNTENFTNVLESDDSLVTLWLYLV